MPGRISAYLRANVLGLVAIFIALGGVSWAATSLKRDSVKSKHIKDGQIQAVDVGADALGAASIQESSLETVPSAQSANTLGGVGAAQLQRRVNDSCGAGQAIGSIADDGSATCVSGATGDITGVTAGSGLTGGGSSGDVSVAVDPTAVQSRVSNTCAVGSAIRSIAENGTVLCESDAVLNGFELVTVSSAFGAGFFHNAFAPCPTGKVLLSGGHEFSLSETTVSNNAAEQLNVHASKPASNGWQVSAADPNGAGDWRVIAYAWCARVE